jgi:hypothetical protein
MCVDTALPALPRPGGVWRAAAALFRALRTRVGKRRAAPAAPAPHRVLRPVVVPGALSELHGPAAGVIELPQRLCWSLPAGRRRFDLGDPRQVRAAYEYVIDAARTPADLTDWLDAGLLASVWGRLGMGRAKRQAWESALPVLAGRRAAAA